MIIDCQTNLTGRLSALEMAEFNDAVGPADAYFLLAAPQLAALKDSDRIMVEFIAKNPKAMGFAPFDPVNEHDPAAKAGELISERGIKGIALYCPHNKMHPMHSKAMCFYEWAQDSRVPIYFYNNMLTSDAVIDYCQPYMIDEVARTYPKLTIIIGNAGKPFINQTIAVAAKHPNVYSTLSINPAKMWSVYNILTYAYEADALDKFLFSSNYPQSTVSQCMEALLGFNRSLADTKLPLVPLEKIRNIINRNSINILCMN